MEENVALDSKKQKKFDKSIKGIKKLLKKKADEPHVPAVLAPKDTESEGAKKKKHFKEKGLVYLSHIPHGFYEHEMTQYFKQFGMVTNVRVIRSARTGRSKGYAFVEFREPEVAEIVAETMNNYLMGKRLIKAAIIPPEKQKRRAFRKHWTSNHNPTADRRVKERKAYNANKTDEEHLKKARKMLSNLQKTKKKLSDLGIDYDFFTPVDVPESLSENVKMKAKLDNKVKIKNEPVEKQKKNKKKSMDMKETVIKENKPETILPKPNHAKNKKEAKKTQEGDKVKQNEKQKKMKDAGVKFPENFIKVGEESGEESDSSLDFDSDEYEKMLENDSDVSSGNESEDDGGEDASDADDDDEEEDGSDDEFSEEELPPLIPVKEKKGKKTIVALPPQPKAAKQANVPRVQKVPPTQPKSVPKPEDLPKAKKGPLPQPQAMKRKNRQTAVSPKKPKFEKKDKPRNKQFKKKNKA